MSVRQDLLRMQHSGRLPITGMPPGPDKHPSDFELRGITPSAGGGIDRGYALPKRKYKSH